MGTERNRIAPNGLRLGMGLWYGSGMQSVGLALCWSIPIKCKGMTRKGATNPSRLLNLVRDDCCPLMKDFNRFGAGLPLSALMQERIKRGLSGPSAHSHF